MRNARGGGDDARAGADARDAGRAAELGGDGGHHARRRLAVGEHDRDPRGAGRVEQCERRPCAGHAEDARHPRAREGIDDDVGDGGPAHRARNGRPTAARPGIYRGTRRSKMGRIRSSANCKFCSEAA